MDVVFGLCIYSGISDLTFKSIERLHKESEYEFDFLTRSGGTSIGHSRSMVATRFLREDYGEKIIMLDSDISFTPDHVAQIVDALDEYPIVGAAYAKTDGGLTAYTKEDVFADGKIVEVEYIAAGFMGINKHTLETMRDELDLPLLMEGTYWECYPFFEVGTCLRNMLFLDEGWAFCEKAIQCGYKIYWHTGVDVGHRKMIELTWKPAPQSVDDRVVPAELIKGEARW